MARTGHGRRIRQNRSYETIKHSIIAPTGLFSLILSSGYENPDADTLTQTSSRRHLSHGACSPQTGHPRRRNRPHTSCETFHRRPSTATQSQSDARNLHRPRNRSQNPCTSTIPTSRTAPKWSSLDRGPRGCSPRCGSSNWATALSCSNAAAKSRPARPTSPASTATARLTPDSNYAFGEGGAGTFSDGKLFTRSKKRGDYNRACRRW